MRNFPVIYSIGEHFSTAWRFLAEKQVKETTHTYEKRGQFTCPTRRIRRPIMIQYYLLEDLFTQLHVAFKNMKSCRLRHYFVGLTSHIVAFAKMSVKESYQKAPFTSSQTVLSLSFWGKTKHLRHYFVGLSWFLSQTRAFSLSSPDIDTEIRIRYGFW